MLISLFEEKITEIILLFWKVEQAIYKSCCFEERLNFGPLLFHHWLSPLQTPGFEATLLSYHNLESLPKVTA